MLCNGTHNGTVAVTHASVKWFAYVSPQAQTHSNKRVSPFFLGVGAAEGAAAEDSAAEDAAEEDATEDAVENDAAAGLAGIKKGIMMGCEEASRLLASLWLSFRQATPLSY